MTMLQDKECREYLGDKSSAEIFDLYLAKGKPGSKIRRMPYVRSKEAIDAIQEAGGFAVVAHPFKDTESVEELEGLIEKGLNGLEVQPNYSDQNDIFREYAEDKGLFITYGSDYHGANLMHRPLLIRNGNLVKEFWEGVKWN
jgi:predicted metal-dependent phosphoesterase TrpH